MTDLAQLERDLLAAVTRPRTSARSKTCASPPWARRAPSANCSRPWARMSPDEREGQRRDVQRAARSRSPRPSPRARPNWSRARWMRGWRPSAGRLPAAAGNAARHRASGEPGEGRSHRHLRRSGVLGRRRPRRRIRRLQFHQAEHSARASGAADARHVLLEAASRRFAAAAAARTPARCRCAPCWRRSRRSASSRRAAPIVDNSDATHSPMFHQVEALVIDEETHLGHLKWLIEEFCKAFFEVSQVAIRLRPVLLPLHRALDGSRRAVRPLGRRAQDRRGQGLAGARRLGHGPSATCWRCAASIRRATRALPSASGSIAWRC